MNKAMQFERKAPQQATPRAASWLRAWILAFAPASAVVVACATVFLRPVIKSIESTPHPQLVYGIFAAFFIGLALCGLALLKFQREAQFIRRWLAMPDHQQRQQSLDALTARTRLATAPALAVLLSALPGAHRHAKFEREFHVVEASFLEKLELPNYIAGALVGLGLVGTFVGLLGTLEDLGAVFGSLANTGNSNVNPTAVFADMVQKLQDPMKGMGTAFVASLYGLLGSLVVGLCALSVSKSAHAALEALAGAERVCAAQETARVTLEAPGDDASQAVTHAQLQALLGRVLQAQADHAAQMTTWAQTSEQRFVQAIHQALERGLNASREMSAHTQQGMGAFVQAVQAQNQQIHALADDLSGQQRGLIETVHTLSRQVQDERQALHKDMQALGERQHLENRQSLERLEKTVGQMALASEKAMRALERHIQMQEKVMDGLPQTSYWKDAWRKVQDYLRTSRQQADLALLADAVSRQTHILEGMSRKLPPDRVNKG